MCPDFAGKMQKKLREMRHLLDEIRKWKKLDFKDFDNFDSILKNAPRILITKLTKMTQKSYIEKTMFWSAILIIFFYFAYIFKISKIKDFDFPNKNDLYRFVVMVFTPAHQSYKNKMNRKNMFLKSKGWNHMIKSRDI